MAPTVRPGRWRREARWIGISRTSVARSPVTRGTSVLFAPVLRLRHAARLAGELVGFAFVNRLWWLLPMVLVLAVASLVIVVGQAAAPVTLYPMF